MTNNECQASVTEPGRWAVAGIKPHWTAGLWTRPALLWIGLALLWIVAAAPAADDFSVLHISDIHVSPHVARSGPPEALRGGEAIAWVCAEAAKRQEFAPGLTVDPPAFAIATGDLTEYGVIDDTWAIFEKAFAGLPCRLWVTPGNHDNTWTAIYAVMRARHGGENYAFDHGGVHFACVCSASPQEPVPTLDAKTRAWLAADLAALPAGTPIVLALHHPPYGDEFANPAEYDTFIDLLKDYNVVLMLYGHGHGVSHRRMDGIDGVMGGSTFGKNAGYGLLSVQEGRLRYAYRYQVDPQAKSGEEARDAWRVLLEKPIGGEAPQRAFTIAWPKERADLGGEQLAVDLSFRMDRTADGAGSEKVTLAVDGQEVKAEETPSVAGDDQHHRAFLVSTEALPPGGHLLTARAEFADGAAEIRARTFYLERPTAEVVWRAHLPAALKAGPLVVDDQVIVADTAGDVTSLDRASGAVRWRFRTGGEILAAPVRTGGLLVFGSGDGNVYAVDLAGKARWRYEAGLPVYGAPSVDGSLVVIGDNGGRLHALESASGKARWTFSRADFSIEAAPLAWRDWLVFGAWDGYVYAVSRENGTSAWKSLGPKASEGKAARYYSPADCAAAALGDSLFVCDRGYQLGMYGADGAMLRRLAEKVSAIAVDAKRQRLIARTIDDRVLALSADGSTVWETAAPAGRFPSPPTVAGDRVYVCGNQGRLSVLDGEDGKVRSEYQATPGFFVMAPVAVDAEGVGYVTGMDGSVTAVRFRE